MEHNWIETSRSMFWIGTIVALIIGGLVMYGAWRLIRSLDD